MSVEAPLYKLYKLRWGPGLLLSLLPLFFAGWYAWSAYAGLDRYLRAPGSGGGKITAELFQIALHDVLLQDVRTMQLPSRPASGRIPTYELSLSREDLDALNQSWGSENKRSGASEYVQGSLRVGSGVFDVRVRGRGRRHWMWINPQKSIQVRLERGELVDDTRVFNLFNEASPFGLEQEIILAVARARGLLAPDYKAVWLRLNNNDMGVYRYEAEPDEGLLRRSRRMPGSLFTGDSTLVDRERQVGALFYDRREWRKVAWRSEEAKEDFHELDRLLNAIGAYSHRDFAAYARDEIALPRYAAFDALDVVFGGKDHDYQSNEMLYADPYTGKIEPLAWGFRAFHHEPVFNLAENPLLLRLLMTPGYVAQRDAVVYDLLTDEASAPAIQARARRRFEALRPELEADPYWDAYRLLPRGSKIMRSMVRPMNPSRWLIAAEDDLEDLARRSRFLLDALEQDALSVHAYADGAQEVHLVATADGHTANRLESVVATGEPACVGTFAVYADVDRDHRLDPARDHLIGSGNMTERAASPATYRDVLPGIRLDALDDPSPESGRVHAVPEAREYSYFVSSETCRVVSVALVFRSLVTGASMRVAPPIQTPPAEREARLTLPGAEVVPQLQAGEHSAHPWDLPAEPVPQRLELGPGTVQFAQTRTFAAHESVHIAAGTRIELGPRASLLFFGRVVADGTSAAPIEIVRLDSARAFGGIALQGIGTRGSRLSNVRVTGGARPTHPTIDYPAMLNIHATRDITLDACTLSNATDTEDVLHANTVEGLSLHELTVTGAPSDAVDLEFVSGELRGLRVIGAGDDCLDLMTSRLRLTDSLLAACTHNAISAGEETSLAALGVVFASSRTGVLSKNHSDVRLSRSVMFGLHVGMRADGREVRYSGESRIGADEIYAVDCEKVEDAAHGASIDLGRVQAALPPGSALGHLAQALGIDDWSGLPAYLARVGASPRAHP